jgi:hypothetical protein
VRIRAPLGASIIDIPAHRISASTSTGCRPLIAAMSTAHAQDAGGTGVAGNKGEKGKKQQEASQEGRRLFCRL